MGDAFNIIDKDNDDILLVAPSEADERAAPDMSATGPKSASPHSSAGRFVFSRNTTQQLTLSEYTFRWRGLDDAPKWFAMRNTARRDIAAGRQHGQRPCCTRETSASVAKSATGGAVCPHVDGLPAILD
ncbi:hypothetical protein [Bradyrhizobium sp. SBR1B]|uniref:hypothetical protein n=1 Tax=Bradyrhizobium sp. SBR1B TaxID=2663836 RepID=UPI0016063D61|nr:hypothetical protein [Bradyrhizobium sp. SBR1B]MBB4383131.1 hypothetical protein [Bradyrhizobium sp. SBR1B]